MTIDNAALTAVITELVRDKGNVVYEWPDDEAAAYRDSGGFAEGRAAVQKLRVDKGVAAVLALVQPAQTSSAAELTAQEHLDAAWRKGAVPTEPIPAGTRYMVRPASGDGFLAQASSSIDIPATAPGLERRLITI